MPFELTFLKCRRIRKLTFLEWASVWERHWEEWSQDQPQCEMVVEIRQTISDMLRIIYIYPPVSDEKHDIDIFGVSITMNFIVKQV